MVEGWRREGCCRCSWGRSCAEGGRWYWWWCVCIKARVCIRVDRGVQRAGSWARLNSSCAEEGGACVLASV